MLFNPETHGQLAQERIEREIAQAALLREARQGRQARQARQGRQARQARQPALSIRRAIGHRIIAIGARLAAEPPLESARSR
jgi:hypothetical protein